MDVIIQSEAAECGLTSIAMIASHHGYKSDLVSLRQQFPQTLKGANLQQLIDVANALRMSSRALRLEMEELSQLSLPCVIHWDMNHFVVLEKVTSNKVQIIDPAHGSRTLDIEEFGAHFTGIALELSPTTDFERKDSRARLSLFDFLANIQGLRSSFIQVLLLSIMLQVFALSMPFYMQLVIDDVVTTFDQQLLLVLALGFGFTVCFNQIIAALRGYTLIHLSSSLNRQVAFNLFNRLIKLPLDFFEKRHMGDIVSRFGSLQEIQKTITHSMVEALLDGVLAVVTLAILFIYSTELASVVLIAMMIYLAGRLISFSHFKNASENVLDAQATESSNFMENVRGIQSIKLFSLESQRQSLWQNLYAYGVNQQIKLSKLQLQFGIFNGLLFGIENIIVIYLGASYIIENNSFTPFTVGILTAFIAYKSQLTTRFTSLIEKVIEFKMLKLHLNRVADIALTPPDRVGTHIVDDSLSGRVDIQKISYRYSPSEPWVLKNASMQVNPGESVAIIGKSGCGKSTLLKLCLGLFEPEDGEVSFNHISLKKARLLDIRKQLGSVMQSDQLLSGSIAENVAQFASVIDLDRVKDCCALANISTEIESMPMGYASLIGDMGTTLSGGQKQRILLARALYSEPQILLLDEATSHLDVVSEKKINQSLKTLNITKLIVAHRPETIAAADRVYLLKNQKLVEVTPKYRQPKQKTTTSRRTNPNKEKHNGNVK